MSERPISELDDAEWLTDARDAEPGMTVLAYDPDRDAGLRQTIETVHLEDQTTLLLENGSAITAERINRVAGVVVEADDTEDSGSGN
jgi:hypothetical protein